MAICFRGYLDYYIAVMPKENALIIDGSNFLWKAYAAPFEFSSESGTRLDVITVFLSLLRSCAAFSKANYVVVVFDHPNAINYRLEDKDYKSNRKQDFSEEIDSPFHHLSRLKLVLDYLDISWVESELAEADDIIHTLAKHFRARVYIASSDTDFYQCLTDSVSILKVRGSKNIEILNVAWLKKSLNVEPEEYVYFKALTGDKADNISGVKGVGPKTASKIINEKDFAVRYDEYKDLVDKNISLIKLREVGGISFNPAEYKVNYKLLEIKNRDIFDSLGF